MTMTGLRTFDETLHATNTWLHEITARMGWDDKQKAYRLLRVCLHALRDRLPIGETAQFSAQLPILVRGVFFEGWRPSMVPLKTRTIDEFLTPIRDAFSNEPDFDAEAAFREFVDVMKMHVSAGEVEDVRRAMPEGLKGLFSDNIVA